MSKANTLIQQATDFLRAIKENPETQTSHREKQVERWYDLQILFHYQATYISVYGSGGISLCPA